MPASTHSVNLGLNIWEASDGFDHTELKDNWLAIDGHDHTQGRGAPLGADTVGNLQLTDNAVGQNEIANGSITTAKIQDGQITLAKLAAAAQPSAGTSTALPLNTAGSPPWRAGTPAPTYRKDSLGIVWLRGKVNMGFTGTIASDTTYTLGTLPTGFRPATGLTVTGLGAAFTGAAGPAGMVVVQVSVLDTGAVTFYTGSSATMTSSGWVSLDLIRFLSG